MQSRGLVISEDNNMIAELSNINLHPFDGESKEERCGIIVRSKEGAYEAREVLNMADNPRIHFRMLQRDVDVAQRTDELVGFVHTHPHGVGRGLSYADVSQLPDGLVGLVYHPVSGSRIIYNNRGPIFSDIKKNRRRK